MVAWAHALLVSCGHDSQNIQRRILEDKKQRKKHDGSTDK